MTALITLTLAGTDTGPFLLFSDVDGFASAFESGVSRLSLISGYTSTLVPNGTFTIRVMSVNPKCSNYIDIPLMPSFCNCITFTSDNSFPGNYTYTSCSTGKVVTDTILPFASIRVCGSNPSVDIEGVTITVGSKCTGDEGCPTICNCLTFIYPKTAGGPIANITYIDCSGALIQTTLSDGNVLQVCGNSPTSDSENVTVIQGGACADDVCPDCNCYTIYRAMEGTYLISYYDCIDGTYMEDTALSGGTTYTICALPGSVIVPVGVVATDLGTNCSAIGGHCGTTTTTTTSVLSTTFNLINNSSGFTADDVYASGGLYFYILSSGSIPCGPGLEAHGDGTTSSAVTVIISGSSSATDLNLYKNGTLQETLFVSTAGTYTFAPVTFGVGDIMLIELVNTI